jgi:hypothetical protein
MMIPVGGFVSKRHPSNFYPSPPKTKKGPQKSGLKKVKNQRKAKSNAGNPQNNEEP